VRLILFAIYLGIGAMLHALLVGSTFDWSSTWTFAWLFGWPIMLVVTFGAAIIVGGIICVLIWMAWEWLKTIAIWRDKHRTK